MLHWLVWKNIVPQNRSPLREPFRDRARFRVLHQWPAQCVIPLTDRANKKKTYPSHVVLNAGDGGLRIDSIALGEQIRSLAVSKLYKRLGQLSPTSINAIGAALRIALDL